MNQVFVDTSGWAALFVEHDAWHASAKEQFGRSFREGWTVFTTNYVLAELASLFTKPLRVPRLSQVRILQEIRAAAWVEVVHVDEEMDRQGWRLWASRTDKDWSLVDCESFVAMQQRGIREALTTDRHFEQAGFLRMLT